MASVAEAATPSTADLVSVIVQERAGTGNGPERAVEALGGSVGRQFSVFQGFSAEVPGDRLDAPRSGPRVDKGTQDAALTPHRPPRRGLLGGAPRPGSTGAPPPATPTPPP